jgi:hypothetical protein
MLCLSRYHFAQEVTKITVNPLDLRQGNYTLSDLAESIEYIPLETNDKCLIGSIYYFDISENYIIVYCPQTLNLYLFDRNGHFISQIGKHGEGPQDYLGYSISCLLIDEKRNRIIVHDKHQCKQLVFDLRGRFVSSVTMDEKTGTGHYERLYNDLFFIYTNNYNGNMPFVYEIRDINLQLMSENIKTVYFKRGQGVSMIGTPRHYLYNNKIQWKETSLNDTIYTVENDCSFKPKYVVNAGKHEVTPELSATPDIFKFRQRMREYVNFDLFFETQDKLLISYIFGNRKYYYCYYDKNDQALLYFKSDKGIPNDYDGGLDFWPTRQDNNTLYAFYDAYLFTEHLSGMKKEGLKGNPKDIKSFKKMMQILDPEDNPVLMIVKLKE